MKRFGVFVCLVLSVALVLGAIPGAEAQGMSGSAASDRITRFLLLGCDASGMRTDSILLVSVNETQSQANIIQIPRDTYAEYTDRDYKKLNGAMSALGARGMKDFLSAALGVKIHYFVVLKLAFFRDLVDAIGGVDVDVPMDMEYEDPAQDLIIHLPQGRTHLDGEQAEQFVRYRSGYADADLGRLDAQKLFLRAFAKQCKSLSAGAILRVLGVALCGVQTDIDLPAAIRTLGALRRADPDACPMQTMPGEAVRGRSGAWYYVLCREACARMLRESCGEVSDFDPMGLFDRESNSDFHRIYTKTMQ